MKTYFSALAVALALAAGVASGPAQAEANRADRVELLRNANTTVTNLKHDPSFDVASTMLKNARAVYIVPKLIKAGFMFGGEGGEGVLLVRNGHSWSAPKFYGMGSASFGLQIGLEQAQLVFIINSERALKGIQDGNFKIGGQGGITVATLSAGAEGATTLKGGDMVVWTSATGAYGGLTFNGSIIKADNEENRAPLPAKEAAELRHNLETVW